MFAWIFHFPRFISHVELMTAIYMQEIKYQHKEKKTLKSKQQTTQLCKLSY